ncbi:MAG: hypothetical protein AAF674_16650 [Pseudomonadota bacterium]
MKQYLFGSVLLLVLAGCDEPTVITHVDKLPHLEVSDLVAMQAADGIAVEIHGQPWKGAAPSALAAALRPPAGASQSTRFFALPPGGHATRHGWRIVLHFNPQGDIPRADQDCKRTAPVQTDNLAADGYSVTLTFCEGEQWAAHAFLKLLGSEPGDLEAFSNAIRQTINVIFQENSDPDR